VRPPHPAGYTRRVRNTALQLPLFGADDDKPGQAPGFSVRQSSRAKRLSIKVFPRGRVEVVVPKRTSARTVEAFVAENQEWIGKARASFARDFSPDAFVLPDIVELPAIGQRTIVSYRPRPDLDKVRYRYAHGILTLTGNTGNETHCVEAFQRWLSGVARREFEPLLKALSNLTGIPYERLHIRMQRTCWGSRSSSGTISLNLCLLFVAPDLLRYLMIHELCHGRHMNHSRRFWQLVGQYEPAYRRLDKQLGDAWRDVPGWLGIY
jgi:predicted metal-dependent hydrolase